MTKKLSLHKETVKVLSDKQLKDAVGGRYRSQNITCDTTYSTCAKSCC
jgi:natural product precursor